MCVTWEKENVNWPRKWKKRGDKYLLEGYLRRVDCTLSC